MQIGVVNGFPAHQGSYIGEMCFDMMGTTLYIWNNQMWNDVSGLGSMGPAGPMGPAGKDADQSLVIKFKWFEKMVDLLAIGKIDEKKYLNLKKMLTSMDDETTKMALQTLKVQHEKYFGE